MMNNAQLEHVDPETLALYAMRTLDAEEYARVRTHVEDCAACRLETEKIRGDLALLAIGGSPLLQPPAHAKARLMVAVQHEHAAVKSRPGLFWKWSFAFSSALAFALIGVLLFQRGELRTLRESLGEMRANMERERAESQQARQIADLLKSSSSIHFTLVSSKSRPQPEAQTAYERSKGQVLLVASNLESLPAEKTYELWLLPTSGAPIPAGLFNPDANGNAQMLYAQLPEGTETKGFAVTVEPRQGSPAPTTTPLLVGTGKS
jgi:hypothetical protein